MPDELHYAKQEPDESRTVAHQKLQGLSHLDIFTGGLPAS